MTCLGGSEGGTCECQGPLNCKLQNHPKYDEYQNKAARRMIRHLSNAVGAELVTRMLQSDPNDVG